MRHAEKSSHSKLGHFLVVKHVDFDAQGLQMLAAFDEAFRIDDVGGFTDQFLGQGNAIGDGSIAGPQCLGVSR